MADAIFKDAKHHHGPVGRVLDFLSRGCAILAGTTLTLMALMSLLSVLGRAFFNKPLVGDYELVQVMSAASIALFLPFCQITRGHVIVDFFTLRAPQRMNDALDWMANLLLAVGALTLAWRISLGGMELFKNSDATMLLGFPTWVVYVPTAFSFGLLGLNCLYAAWEDGAKVLKGARE